MNALSAPEAVDGPSPVTVSWVDAFEDGPFTGNPAAVCCSDRPLPVEWMQALAAELGISETAFVVPLVPAGGTGAPPPDDRFGLRWFTPSTEVDLCGHATLAAAHVLRQLAAPRLAARFVFETRSGQLVAKVVDGNGDIELDLPADPPVEAPLPGCLEPLGEQLRWSGAGRGFVVAELASAEAVRAFCPDLDAIARVPQQGLLVTALGEDIDDYVLRCFAPKMGIAEDPVTGSAQCILAPLWTARTGRSPLRVRQLSARGGTLWARLSGDRVIVGGRAATVLEGTVHPPGAR